MSVVALQRIEAAVRPPLNDVRLDWLVESVSRNRFLPQPDARNIYVGDGDYRSIGAEFLRHFVRIGGLVPTARVLDIGSGIGRMAVPLTQFLDDEATYDGLDPVLEGVTWCARSITPIYPRFRFQRLDVAHPIYNPHGTLSGEEIVTPFRQGSFDFVFMISVATHLPPGEIEAYAREIFRLLAPGGRLFLTAFIMEESARAGTANDPRLDFKRSANGPDWCVDPDAPLGAVAFDDGWIEATLARSGLEASKRSLGYWRGVQADHYQDILVATKPHREGK